MKLEILGNCPTCGSLLYERVLQSLEMAGLMEKFQVERIKDPDYFLKMGVLMTPALVLDGDVISTGKLLLPGDILKLLKERGIA